MTKAKQLFNLLKKKYRAPDIADCRDILVELNESESELHAEYNRILRAIIDGDGCVIMVAHKWRVLVYSQNHGKLSIGGGDYDETIKDMIRVRLLGVCTAAGGQGMKRICYVTNTGRLRVQQNIEKIQ